MGRKLGKNQGREAIIRIQYMRTNSIFNKRNKVTNNNHNLKKKKTIRGCDYRTKMERCKFRNSEIGFQAELKAFISHNQLFQYGSKLWCYSAKAHTNAALKHIHNSSCQDEKGIQQSLARYVLYLMTAVQTWNLYASKRAISQCSDTIMSNACSR